MKVVGLDGTYLKGPHSSHILAVVGIDGNNMMYPIAFAVEESECKATWKWFVEILREDIGIQVPLQWTIISDKQKSLTKVLQEELDYAEHRFCVRHLCSNFKKSSLENP